MIDFELKDEGSIPACSTKLCSCLDHSRLLQAIDFNGLKLNVKLDHSVWGGLFLSGFSHKLATFGHNLVTKKRGKRNLKTLLIRYSFPYYATRFRIEVFLALVFINFLFRRLVMSTQSNFFIYLGGQPVGSSASLEEANEELTTAVLNRALRGNGSAVTGEIRNGIGDILQTRQFGEAIYGGMEDES